MERLDEERYIQERLQGQIDWFDAKSSWNQRWYKRLKAIEILAAALIPLLSGFATSLPGTNSIMGGLGVVIAFISGVLALNRFQENWTDYRATAEALRHHKYRYLTASAPYHVKEPFLRLVENVEQILAQENGRWREQARQPVQGEGAEMGG